MVIDLLKRLLRFRKRRARSDDWNSYFRSTGGSVASIFVDLELRKKAPDKERPELLFLSLEMNEPRDDGLSSSAEFETLCRIEDNLTTVLHKKMDAVFCGRITTGGRREFFYYAKRSKGLEGIVGGILKGLGGYQFRCGAKADAPWNQYVNVLYPSDEERQSVENQKVLQVLERNGDTLKAPRDVRHWIYFCSERDRENFSQSVLGLGYRIESRPSKGSDAFPVGLAIFKLQSVGLTEIDEAVLELYRLAKDFNGDYDGWETQAIRELQ